MGNRTGWSLALMAGMGVALAGCMHGNEVYGLTEAQADRLADRVLENTPEYTHFEEGTVFSWILLDAEKVAAPQEVQRAVLERLREKYTVYAHESDIPDSVKIRSDGGHLQGYRDGFRFTYRVELESRGSIKVHYSDWEGMFAASGHWERYAWRDGDWQIVEESPMVFS